MILEWLLSLVEDLLSWILDLMSFELVPQEAVLDVGAGIAPWAHGIADLGVWIPWGVLGVWVPLVGGVYFASLALKFFKNLFSHVPLIGGKG